MLFTRHLPVLLALIALTACDNSRQDAEPVNLGDPTPEELARLEAQTVLRSGFLQPGADGSYPVALTSLFRGSYRDSDGNGYAIGLHREDTQIGAVVGLLPGTTGGTLPLSGTASMSGRYHLAEIGKSHGEDREYAEPAFTIGAISVNVNFEQGILSGDGGDLQVDGRFTSSTLQGSAIYKGRSAVLAGQIGADRAVGVFHGTDSDTAMVGGFMATP